jgi:hypothetical protein
MPLRYDEKRSEQPAWNAKTGLPECCLKPPSNLIPVRAAAQPENPHATDILPKQRRAEIGRHISGVVLV